MNYIEKNPGVKIKDMVSILEIPTDTMDKYIKFLTEKGWVERRGSKKTGGYFVKKKPDSQSN